MRTFYVAGLFLLPLLAACSGAGTSGILPLDGGAPNGNDDAAGDPHDTTAEDPEDDSTPHALGTIVVGEAHEAGQSESTPRVSVTFVPSVSKKQRCAKTIAGCEVVLPPQCNDVKVSDTGCEANEACVWDDACKPSCKPVLDCADACDRDEACVAGPHAKDPSVGTCQKIESFDAGPIAFSGTTTPISLFPPYSYEPKSDGAPFVGGASLKVKAQGAVNAGFDAFEESFTATSFIQTKPALDRLPLENVFGSGPLTVGWVPGTDEVIVSLSADGGASATCKAKDAAGSFDVPRAVIDAVRASDSGGGSGTLRLSIERRRQELKKGEKTKGKLAHASIEPVGWLALTTVSSESTVFEGCPDGYAPCGRGCAEVASDPANCGACGHACDDGVACVAGQCQSGGTCAAGPENTLAKCSDGCSNDGDPYVDCDDYDCCSVRTNCPATTACGKK